ncbi:MAG: CDP-alcohol phosphatidyltransferase family protein, partial [Nanoarchaeota archaeon]
IYMSLYDLRALEERIFKPIQKVTPNINPNIYTLLSLAAAIFASFFFYKGTFILASLFVIINSFFDMIDGLSARKYDRVTKKGDFLDDIVDRYADIIMLLGIVLSPYCNSTVGFTAIIAMIMVSYIGAQSKATGGIRATSGLLGRPERNLLLIIVPIIQYALLISGNGKLFNIWVMELLMYVFIIFGVIAAIQRFIEAWKKLD